MYLSLIVLIPLCALAWKSTAGGLAAFSRTLGDKQVQAALELSFGASFVAALLSGFFGLMTAWALERYDFASRRLLDSLVDLPFALPTAVAGIALVTLYSQNGWIGEWLARWGVEVAFTPIGVTLALVFVGFPFVVRTVQPVIQDLSLEPEEVAACLGANRWQTFTRVIIPPLLPSALAGMMLALGRAVGEFGSVVFISGNLPYKTEIAPLLIISKLEQYDYPGAAVIGLVMLLASFGILVGSNILITRHLRRFGR